MKIKQPTQSAQACVIWMHGLGADAANIMALVEQLQVNWPIRHVCLDAPVRAVTLFNHMRVQAWYDIFGLAAPVREDVVGIAQSQQAIEDVIRAQIDSGIAAERIFLAGFSQGAAMALYTGLHTDHAIAGVICLSGYLPIAASCTANLARTTPIFIGMGVQDNVVIPAWTEQSVHWLQTQGFSQLSYHQYPMEHTVCAEELADVSVWLNQQAGARA